MFPFCVTPMHDSSWPWHISQQLHGHPWAPAGVCLLLLHTQWTVSDSWGRQYQMGDLLFTIIHTTTSHLAEIHWSNAELPLFIFCHFKSTLPTDLSSSSTYKPPNSLRFDSKRLPSTPVYNLGISAHTRPAGWRWLSCQVFCGFYNLFLSQ